MKCQSKISLFCKKEIKGIEIKYMNTKKVCEICYDKLKWERKKHTKQK